MEATRGRSSFTVVWTDPRTPIRGYIPGGTEIVALVVRRLVSNGLLERVSSAPFGVQGFQITDEGLDKLGR